MPDGFDIPMESMSKRFAADSDHTKKAEEFVLKMQE
jgi:hypothetical protein